MAIHKSWRRYQFRTLSKANSIVPELRRNPLTGGWVNIAPQRAQRPGAFADTSVPTPREACPFCPGNEHLTPPEVLAYRSASGESENWTLRVVPNKYPAFIAVDHDKGLGDGGFGDGAFGDGAGLQVAHPAAGAHEVVIESRRHVASLTELTPAECADAFWAYRERIGYWRGQGGFRYAQMFKNSGQAAGASIPHIHSQLAVLSHVPTLVETELAAARAYFESESRCLLCRMIDVELAAGNRVVTETAEMIAFCPFASRFPFEMWIAPKDHSSHYEHMSRPQSDEIASFMQRILARLEACRHNCAYNYVLHTGPIDTQPLQYYHWHFEVIPRLSGIAGFELGTGVFINPVLPEIAATRLREAEI